MHGLLVQSVEQPCHPSPRNCQYTVSLLFILIIYSLYSRISLWGPPLRVVMWSQTAGVVANSVVTRAHGLLPGLECNRPHESVKRPHGIHQIPCESTYVHTNPRSSTGGRRQILNMSKTFLHAPVDEQGFAWMYMDPQGLWQMLYGLLEDSRGCFNYLTQELMRSMRACVTLP